MITLDPTDRVTICGLPGTGKTTLARYLASLYEPNLLIYDPLGQYDGFPDECRYIPRSDSLAEFDGLCRQLRARSDIVFMVEEAERYLGQGKPLGEHTFDLVNRGRNWGVGIVAVTRRIQRLSKDYFDLCQHCFFFRCGLKSKGVKGYIRELVGDDILPKIRGLREFEFLHYDVETEENEVATLVLGARPHIEKGAKTKAKEEEHGERRESPGEVVRGRGGDQGKVSQPLSRQQQGEDLRGGGKGPDTTQR